MLLFREVLFLHLISSLVATVCFGSSLYFDVHDIPRFVCWTFMFIKNQVMKYSNYVKKLNIVAAKEGEWTSKSVGVERMRQGKSVIDVRFRFTIPWAFSLKVMNWITFEWNIFIPNNLLHRPTTKFYKLSATTKEQQKICIEWTNPQTKTIDLIIHKHLKQKHLKNVHHLLKKATKRTRRERRSEAGGW